MVPAVVHADPVDDQIQLFDLSGLQKAHDPVGIADGGDLRRRHHKGAVSAGDGVCKP